MPAMNYTAGIKPYKAVMQTYSPNIRPYRPYRNFYENNLQVKTVNGPSGKKQSVISDRNRSVADYLASGQFINGIYRLAMDKETSGAPGKNRKRFLQTAAKKILEPLRSLFMRVKAGFGLLPGKEVPGSR
ncbi:MAG TPA: hypothetical protein VFU15_05795 [Bacteroidia bacterium]|nr:hypothetical protein [Bacteroidia bacterium]